MTSKEGVRNFLFDFQLKCVLILCLKKRAASYAWASVQVITVDLDKHKNSLGLMWTLHVMAEKSFFTEFDFQGHIQ